MRLGVLDEATTPRKRASIGAWYLERGFGDSYTIVILRPYGIV